MNFILVLSILVRLAALGWSALLWQRLRDWRVCFLAVMVAFMLLRQLLTLGERMSAVVAEASIWTEMPGLVVSFMVLLGVYFLGNVLVERMQAVEKMRENEARLRLVVDQMPLILWTTDKDLKITSAQGAALRMLDVTPEHVGDASLPEFLQTEDPDHPSGAKMQQALQGEPVMYESSFHGRVYLSYVEPLRDAGGQIIGSIGTAIDITERKRAEEEREQLYQEVQTARQRLAALMRQLITTQETERRHLAYELHDQIGQTLTAINANLKFLQRKVNADFQPLLQESTAVVSQAIEQVRDLSLNLRPPMLDDFGLSAALKWCIENVSQKTDLQIHFQEKHSGADLPADLKNTFFRIAQEALTNVIRHAEAKNVWIDLTEHDNDLELCIRDDGKGFDVAAAQKQAVAGESMGLVSMQERVDLLGGQFALESEPGQGTILRIRLPLPLAAVDEGEEP